MQNALQIIINSQAIKSDRHRKFLSFIVNEKLAGRDNRIKAYTIATEVFERSDDFDSAADPIVRVEAGRLRRVLEKYYLTEGNNDSLIIEIPNGGYAPDFYITETKQTHVVDKNETDYESKPATNVHTLLMLPIDYYGETPAYEYFADGLCEEIVISLSQYKSLNVRSAASHPDSEDTASTSRKLGARFTLTGTVRVYDDILRVSIRLLDAIEYNIIMGRQYEYPNDVANLFTIQKDITSQVSLHVADVYEGAIPRLLALEPKEIDCGISSYDALLRVHYYNRCFSVETYEAARTASEEAVKTDPQNPYHTHSIMQPTVHNDDVDHQPLGIGV